MNFNVREEIIKLTPQWKGERLPDGRPKVDEKYLKALKTLTLRLRGSKTELEEMGEDVTDMAKTTSQLQAKLLALTGGKVDIMLDEN